MIMGQPQPQPQPLLLIHHAPYYVMFIYFMNHT